MEPATRFQSRAVSRCSAECFRSAESTAPRITSHDTPAPTTMLRTSRGRFTMKASNPVMPQMIAGHRSVDVEIGRRS